MNNIFKKFNFKWHDSYLSVITAVLLVIIIAAMIYTVTSSTGSIVSREGEPGDIADQVSQAADETLPDTLPVLGRAPELTGIVDWINTEPLTSEELRGKVVLIDFWTYSCINCIRTLPYVQSWHEKYSGKDFVLLGVHTPEFDFEKRLENVLQAMDEYGVTYPVALDNDYATWNAWRNRFWPAHYLIDVDGNIRYFHFGEGKYAETEAAIQKLLIEGGLATADELVNVAEDPEAEQSLSPRTPEIYLGYERLDHFSNGAAAVVPNEPTDFTASDVLATDTFSLDGRWTVGPEAAQLAGDEGTIAVNYQGKEVNMVLADPGGASLIEVTLDGKPLTEATAGQHIIFQDGRSYVRVEQSQLYELVKTTEPEQHVLRIRVTSPTFEAFTYTFG